MNHSDTIPAPTGAATPLATHAAPHTTTHASTHYLIVTGGTAGDLYPFLSLGQALQACGHRVTFCSPAVFGAQITATGMGFVPTVDHETYAAVLNDPDVWNPEKAFEVIWRATRDKLSSIHDLVASLPADQRCVLLAHPLGLPMCALARALRPQIPIVALYLAPSNLRSCHDPLMLGPLRIPRWVPQAWRRWLWARVEGKMIDPVAVPDINAARTRLGLPPVASFLDHLYQSGDFSVTLFPDWFAPLAPDWPTPMISGQFQLFEPSRASTISPELQAFLAQGSAPLVFTPGSGHRHADAYFAAAVAAAQKLGRHAVLVTSHRAQVPAVLPETVLWQEYVAFRDLLPHAALLVHHGGIGTTAEALRAGVPQLVVPFAHDQFDNGMRVELLGVGRSLHASRLSQRRLYRCLHALLDSEAVRAQAASVAGRFATAPGAAALVAQIEAQIAGQANAGQPGTGQAMTGQASTGQPSTGQGTAT